MRRATFARPIADGVEIRLHLTPRSSFNRIEGLRDTADGPALGARVRAAPSDGEANDAACRLLAEWLGIAQSCVALTAGHKSRIKVLKVRGDATALERKIQDRMSDDR